jgi:hypothetical protein
MSVREDLLRLTRWRLEERRSYLANLQSLAARLRADAARLAAEIADSNRRLGEPSDASAVSPLFHGALVQRHDKIVRSIVELDAQIAEASSVVAAAAQEVEHAAAAAKPRGEADDSGDGEMPLLYRRRRVRGGAVPNRLGKRA